MSSRATAGNKRRFLEIYARVGNVWEACRQANIARRSHYEWLEGDPDYKAAFNDAKEDACDNLLEEARRRGHEGVEEPVYWQGQVVGAVRKYSDNMLMFLIKGMRPEVYRDNWRGELTHTGSLAVSRGPDLTKLSNEQLELAEQLALTAAANAAAVAGSGIDPEGEGEESAEQNSDVLPD